MLDDFPREDVHLMIIPQPLRVQPRRSGGELDPEAEARFAHRMGGGGGSDSVVGTPW